MHACIDIYVLISSECWLQAVCQGLIAAAAREKGHPWQQQERPNARAA